MKNKLLISFAILAVMIVGACNNNDKDGKKLSTTTSGEVNVVVDETFRSIIEAEKEVFETIYPKAKLHIRYISEMEAFNEFLADSASLIITSRELNEEELNYFKSIPITTQTNKFAVDAIAMIVNKNNADTTFELSQVREIIRGNISNWNQLNPKNNKGDIQVVFDHANSSTVRYMAEMVGQKTIEGKNIYALNSNEEVLNYVGENDKALGIIGINWISDTDDSVTVKFKENIYVVGIKGDPADKGDDYYYQPYQAYIATQQYPLTRNVYSISREPRTGLATGFVTFLSSERGQRIVLKSGLLPAKTPIRVIQLSE